MPVILQRISHSRTPPTLGVVDTDIGEASEIDLTLGSSIPPFAIWTDSRYCRCGSRITKGKAMDVDFDPMLSVSLNYMCQECAKEDQLNLCTIYGVWRDDRSKVRCHQCYKWASECSSSFCLYLACLSSEEDEIKVGITRLGRRKERAREAGYTQMAILLPEDRNSLSLAEAEFLEKRIFSGTYVSWDGRSIKIGERFTRDIGMVGSEATRKLTYASFLQHPSESDRRFFSDLVQRVTEAGSQRCLAYAGDESAGTLTPLKMVELIEDSSGYAQEEILRGITSDRLSGIKTRTFKGRRYRRVPEPNQIIGVKGPCIILKSGDEYPVLRLSKNAASGRELFDPRMVVDLRQDGKEATLDWF